MLVAEAITCAVRCQRLKVNVAVSFFDVIYFESKVVGLVYNKAKVFVVEVLRSDLCTTRVFLNGNLGFFDDTDGITEVRDFTEVIGIRD